MLNAMSMNESELSMHQHHEHALACVPQQIAGLSVFKNPDAQSISNLITSYQTDVKRIETMLAVLKSSDAVFALNYLQSGPRNWVRTSLSSIDEALKGLSADYWKKALDLTDVLDHMTAESRIQWQENIAGWEVPLFEQETVITTILDLLTNRDKFLAQKVEGIFKSLSKVHVTNSPSGFTQRFIIENILSSTYRKEAIDDLRQLIAKFMGREISRMRDMNTGSIIENAWKNDTGKWLEMDGGALKFKVFKKQTIHIEIHPDIAWRLNEILAVLHPHAIPQEFKTRKAGKKIKDFQLTQHLLSNDLLNMVASLVPTRIWDKTGYEPRVTGCKENSVSTRYYNDNNAQVKELDSFLASCGAVRINKFSQEWQFEYDFLSIRDEIVRVGKAPEHISHQYFPTPTDLALEVLERLEIVSTDTILEPSAGQAGLAKHLKGCGKSVTCVEVSKLNSLVLEAIGFDAVVNQDFIQYANNAPKFDKIAMNPPFSAGRAKLHVETAMELLSKTGAKLVAIVPPTLKNKLNADGYDISWSATLHNRFENTGVTVCIVEITKL
ncbi:DUF4942 domain-containing protein [Shewanella aestuarii]|uniref:DUF4942 domain-containing protein n=1 Tax=Shewanella aestuarii TaxID=1028752 RepID=A0A6G9QPX2_9GAMM|nr:DUF4942 domain-containing protein [Shewanella aestuarii]QIR16640.1 DUF4942 domain-containing protein [Shewanella aestuarii]